MQKKICCNLICPGQLLEVWQGIKVWQGHSSRQPARVCWTGMCCRKWVTHLNGQALSVRSPRWPAASWLHCLQQDVSTEQRQLRMCHAAMQRRRTRRRTATWMDIMRKISMPHVPLAGMHRCRGQVHPALVQDATSGGCRIAPDGAGCAPCGKLTALPACTECTKYRINDSLHSSRNTRSIDCSSWEDLHLCWRTCCCLAAVGTTAACYGL